MQMLMYVFLEVLKALLCIPYQNELSHAKSNTGYDNAICCHICTKTKKKIIMLFYVALLLTMFSMKGEVFVRRISSFPEMTLIAYKICCQPDLLAPNQTTYRNKEQLFS